MDQVAVLTISVPSAIAGLGALWYVISSGPGISEKLESRAGRVQVKLQLSALDILKSLRVVLDDIFEEYDAGDDTYLTRARPGIALEAIREYNRLTVLQTRVAVSAEKFRSRSRHAFWIALSFALAMAGASVLAAIYKMFNTIEPAIVSLEVAGAILVIGGVAFAWAVGPYRIVDKAEIVAAVQVKKRPAVAEALEDLRGEGGSAR